MKYYLIAGEASGDLHGARLMQAISEREPQAEFRAWGGDLMAGAGATLVKHINETSIMGFAEVAKKLPVILKNIRLCKSDILEYQPDAVIFIDFPGFNLRIAPFVKKAGFRAFYFISPTVWAWKKSRMEIIRRNIEQLYVILPFEKDFYAQHGIEVTFAGNPLTDAINEFKQNYSESRLAFLEKNKLPHQKIIALLPGSRQQELDRLLPLMLPLCKQFTDYGFVIAAAPTLSDGHYKRYIRDFPVTVVRNQTYALLSHSEAAVVTSGTATLETALLNVPQVVVYKTSALSYTIARLLVRLKFISLVNLIAQQEVVKELIQSQLTPGTLKQALEDILNEPHRRSILTAYAQIREKLGNEQVAGQLADDILNRLHYKAVQ